MGEDRPQTGSRPSRRRWWITGAVVLLVTIGVASYRWPGRGILTYFGIELPSPFNWGAPSAHQLLWPRFDVWGLANFAQISPELYRGAQPGREGFVQLQKMGVRTVVNLREFHNDRKLMAGLGLRYVQLPFNPVEPEDELVAKFLKVVGDPANQPVFVHCQAGADRTGTMVVMYRVVEQGWPVAEAVKELPRFGFHMVWTDLTRYLAETHVQSLRARVAQEPAVPVEVIP